jgi:uncharacterized repeat protein (TIGR02543 family)
VNNKAYGTALGMTAPTRTGYTFDGWIDIDTEASYSSTSTMPDKNLDLIGEWTINNYTIGYDLDSGTAAVTPSPTSYTVLDSISIPSPTRTGWVFVGWDKGTDDTADHTPTAGTTTISAGTYTEDLTLKAIWTQSIYRVTYDSNGGSPVNDKTFTYTQALDGTYFPTPTKGIETFTGWFDANDRKWDVGASFSNIGPNNNLALTARWATQPNSITFEPENGEKSHTKSAYPGSLVEIGFTPYKEGYRFVGWLGQDGLFYTATSIMPAGSLILTAQWELR